MASVISTSLWEYYEKTDDDTKVICKFCNKILLSKRNFNLKVHLIHVHKIPVYTEKRPKVNRNAYKISRLEKRLEELKQLQYSKAAPADTQETQDNSFEDTQDNSFQETQYNKFQETNGEFEIHETIVKSDYDITEEVPTEDITTVNEATFEYGDDIHYNTADVSTRNSTERQVITTIIPDNISEISPTFKKTVLPREPVRTKSIELQPQNKKNTAPPAIDPLEESPPSTKDDNFDQWAHKKEKLMHLEYIEMRNYKFKLELWEKEQQLRLASSKYTRDLRNNP